MPELTQVNKNVYYLADHLNFGVVKVGDREAVVIDTGIGDDSAQMILAALEAEGLDLAAIINTHSHADHYGGNNYLVRKTGCKVYAPPIEAAIMNNPSLEPLYIYGANAPAELKQPFLMGKVSPVDVLLDKPGVTIGSKEFEIIPLKGHSPNQIGVFVDDVFFCGDSVFSKGAWQSLVLVYAVNIKETIQSIELLRKYGAKSFVPSHAAPTGDIEALAYYNLKSIQVLARGILDIVGTPAEVDTILWEINKKHGLAMKSLQQYYLCINTLKAYLTYLLEEELITFEFEANRLMWKSIV